MYTVFPAGDNWTGAEKLQGITNLVYPGSIIAVILNVIGVIAFYAFRRNRKFPIAILGWIALENIFYSTYLVTKWAPGTKSREVFLLHITEKMCFFILWIDTWNFWCLVVLNFMIALVLYLTICMKRNIEYKENPRYFWGFLISFLVIMIVVPFATVGSGEKMSIFGSCSYKNVLMELIPEAIMIGAEIFFVTSAMISARRIIRGAKSINTRKSDRRMMYMLVRFTLTIVSQICVITGFYTLQVIKKPPIPVLKFALIFIVLAPTVDATIILLGNRPLIKWIFEKFRFSFFHSSGSSDSGPSKEMDSRDSKFTGETSDRNHSRQSVHGMAPPTDVSINVSTEQ